MIITDTTKCLESYKKDFKHSFKRNFIFFLLNFGLAFSGGFMFLYIEYCYDVVPPEISKQDLKLTKLCNNSTNMSKNSSGQLNVNKSIISNNCMFSDMFMVDFQSFCKEFIHVSQKKNGCNFSAKNIMRWLEYTFTIHFTIGWGRIVPRSNTGMIATIIYAVPAITVCTLNHMFAGRVILDALKIVIILIETKVFKRQKIIGFNRKIIISLFVLTLLSMFLFGMYIKPYTDHLSVIQRIYFMVVTILTIGFGDFVYDTEEMASYDDWPLTTVIVIFCFVNIFACVASLITAIVEAISGDETNKDENSKESHDHKLSIDNMIEMSLNEPS